ncbi:SsgA family sporulation/cell division regulator [Streptomyces sp. NPDC057052]|uniref:SsgA family sporulation/cell division regulator n=1 Tax=Streptomyces sp. NPDC057052 TaxID=3346010 RepID=UPI003638C656
MTAASKATASTTPCSAPLERANVVCRFRYDRSSPFSVRLDFGSTPDDEVTWVISRDLLPAGTEGFSGEGDVKIWPSRQRGDTPSLYLRLERPGVTAMFVADLHPVRHWLDDTYVAVPAGNESMLVDWNALAGSLLPPA